MKRVRLKRVRLKNVRLKRRRLEERSWGNIDGRSMYKAVVFDLDGTLLDTLDDLCGAVNATLKKFAFPTRTKEEVRSFIGNGIRLLVGRAMGDCSHPQLDEALEEFKRYYAEHCKDETRPYEGIMPLLGRLREQGIQTGVLSNKADFATRALVEEYFGGLIEKAAGENEAAGIRKKPAPDALFAMMDALGVTREETLYVGDSEVDIQTAQNAGVDCVCVLWGFKDEAFLRANGGVNLIREPYQLLPFLGITD